MSRAPFLLLLPLSMTLGGCGPAEEDPAEHACEQVSESGTAVVGGETIEDAAAISLSEEPYTVTLSADAPVFVAVTVAEETEAVLFLKTANVLTGIVHDGEAQTLPAGAPNAMCAADIPEHFDLDLEPGTWTLQLGPAAADSVWLMLMEAEGHED